MPVDVVINVPSSPAPAALFKASTHVLLHHKGHFRVLERNLRDFLHLERQLQLENEANDPLPDSVSVSFALKASYDTKSSFYPSKQLGTRLEIALETFLRPLVSNSELLRTSLAFKTFLDGNLLTRHSTIGESYRDAIEDTIQTQMKDIEVVEERIAAGCSVEHQVVVKVTGEKQLVLWKFASQDTGLLFSALFASGDGGTRVEVDPYSVSSGDVGENEVDETEVAHYKTFCNFKTDEGYVYGHYVAEVSGVVTLLWENVNMDSVVSKPLRFQAKAVSLSAAKKVLEVADAIKTVDTAEWLHDYVEESEVMSVEDLWGWEIDESLDAFGEDEACDDGFAGGDSELESQIQSAVLEERNHDLEAQVIRLEESLMTTKKELTSALDRVQTAEEIYKANLETITQLECATVGGTTPKSSRVATKLPAGSFLGTQKLEGAQTEETPSSELERVQKICAGFQEQCLWRSVENMELETQLAASQVEACSWRERTVEQGLQLKKLEKQNCTLRTHKKMLVQEVKRLQPYAQVNLAALVQEAQEARMMQRSLQAQLDLHEPSKKSAIEGDVIELDTFVLVEASDDQV